MELRQRASIWAINLQLMRPPALRYGHMDRIGALGTTGYSAIEVFSCMTGEAGLVPEEVCR